MEKNDTRFEDRPVLELVLFACVGCMAAMLFVVRSGFSIFTYPWYFPDSYDWLVNGLAYTGVPVPFEISHRTMLLPLVVAALYKLGAPDLAVYFGLVGYVLSVVVAYYGLRLVFGARSALIACALYAASFSLLGQSAFLGSDVMANCLVSGAALYYLAFLVEPRGRRFVVAAAFMAIGIHVQYIGAILLPCLLLASCIEGEGRSLRLTTRPLRHMLLNRGFYAGALVGLAIVFALLAPRLLQYQMLYTERVQHGSLVKPYSQGFRYYITGSLCIFGWPLVLLAACGIWQALRRGASHTEIYMLAWLAWIWAFFALLYTWMDIRFLLYIAVPFHFFAARGLIGLVDQFPSLIGSRLVSYPLAFALCLSVLLFANSRANPSPWHREIALTPRHGFLLGDRRLVSGEMAPYMALSFDQAQAARERLASQVVDNSSVSEPLIAFMQKLREVLSPDQLRHVWYYQPLGEGEMYFVKNRNILYLGSDIRTSDSTDQILDAVRSSRIVLVAHADYVRTLAERWRSIGLEENRVAELNPYLAVEVGNPDPVAHPLPGDKTMELIAQISGAEYPERLFNGIRDLSSDWAAAPLNVPINVTFKEPVKLDALKVQLYDYDQRYYRLRIETLVNGSWQKVFESPESGSRGEQVITLGGVDVTGLRLTGSFNSDQLANPANTILHVKEIELVRRTS